MNLPIRNSRFKLQQGQIFWREIGQGATIVFLHGSWQDSEQWKSVLEQLGSNYHCLAPDLLGFGESEHPNLHYSIELELECLADFFETLKLREIYLVGHSLGGWVAASYALRYPQQVSGLILLAPEGVEIERHRHRWQRARLLLLPITGWLLRGLYLLKWPHVFRLLQERRQLLAFQPACQLLFHRRWAEVKSEFLQERLGWLKIPMLIIQGEHDRLDMLLLSQTYARLAPQANLIQISSAGEDLPQSQPHAVAAAIRSFMNKAS